MPSAQTVEVEIEIQTRTHPIGTRKRCEVREVVETNGVVAALCTVKADPGIRYVCFYKQKEKAPQPGDRGFLIMTPCPATGAFWRFRPIPGHGAARWTR